MTGEIDSNIIAGLSKFILESVEVTSNVLGCGSYASVLELNYHGLKCAGKKIHETILSPNGDTYISSKFVEEISLLSRVRHPNIVQFLGVCFHNESSLPVLIMEYLPTTLTACIHQYGILPKEITFSILHDVALGLAYLHGQNPPIIHRDLSSNNILLTNDLLAKISDLGVARLLNLPPVEASHLTQIPGTPAFMPPEVMTADPKYDTSIDVFSLGVVMIHILSSSWPEPQLAPSLKSAGRLIPLSEAERRKNLFCLVDENHPLMDLTLKCIDNDPTLRPLASVVEKHLVKLVTEFPLELTHRMEIIRKIQSLTDEVKKLKSQVKQLKEQVLTENELVSSAIEALQKVQKKKSINAQPKERVEVLKTKSNLKHKVKFTILKEDSVKTPIPKPRKYKKKVEHDSKPAQEDFTSDPQRGRTLEMLTESSLQEFLGGQTTSSMQSLLSCPIFIGDYNYKARSSSDLNVTRGDQLIITDMSNSEWWYARSLTTSQEGFVPRNHLSEVNKWKMDRTQFRLKTKLGTGTIFEVWKGSWGDSLPVAVKIAAEELVISPECIDELERIKQLTNHNLVPLLAASTENGPLQIITEFYELGSLLQYLHSDGKYLAFSQLIKAGAQVAEGMAFLEQEKFVHQSLATRNVMITETLSCKIADYGFARLVQQDDCFAPNLNSRWTSPESLLSSDFTTKSDIWSFGIVLHEIITYGSVPYKDISNDAVIEKVQNGYRLPCPSDCPKSLYNIMLSCWNGKPEQRPTFELLRKQLMEYHSSLIGGYEYVP